MPIQHYDLSAAGIRLPGIGLKAAELDDGLNIVIDANQDISGRPGCQDKITGVGGYGQITHTYVDVDGVGHEELLVLNENLYRVETGSLNVTYVGTETHCTLSILAEDGSIRCRIEENEIVLLDMDLGIGYEETAIVTVADLVSAIDSLAACTCSATGDTTVPAAFIDISENNHVISGQTTAIPYSYVGTVNHSVDVVFDGLLDTKETDQLKNVFGIPHKNLLVLVDGASPKVYDGQSIYKAGLPTPGAPYINKVAGLFSNHIEYSYSYEFKDNVGNITEGGLSDPTSVDLVSEEAVLTLRTLDSSSGYKTNCALINGTQNAVASSGIVTLTVSAGHTLVAGDTAFLLNRLSSVNSNIEATVLSVTSTTISLESTIDISVTDSDVVSANLKINIYRSEGTDNTKYLIKTLPNNSFVTFLSFQDTPHTATTNGAQVLSPIANQIIITVDSGHTVLAGDVLAIFNHVSTIDDTVYYDVVGVTATSITISSTANLTVVDNQVILQSKYSFPAYTEGDDTLATEPPPDADLAASYRGGLILAKGNKLFFSDEVNNGITNSSMSFPSINIKTFNTPITSLFVSGDYLIVGQNLRIEALSSTQLGTTPYNQVTVTDLLGILSHASVVQAGSLTFFVSHSGIYSLSGREVSPQAVSADIESFFRKIDLNDPEAPSLKRSVGVNDIFNRRLIFYFPQETAGNLDFSAKSAYCWVWSYADGKWFRWDNLHMSGGASVYNNRLWFSERVRDKSLRTNVKRLSNDVFWDHASPISCKLQTKWDFLGSSGMGQPKKLGHVRAISRYRPGNSIEQPDLNCKIYQNLIDNWLHTNAVMAYDTPAGSFPWNEFPWNVEQIGSWTKAHTKIKCSGTAIEALKLSIEVEVAGSNFNLSALEVDYKYLNTPSEESLKT